LTPEVVDAVGLGRVVARVPWGVERTVVGGITVVEEVTSPITVHWGTRDRVI